jgi:aminoglycoside phosphotransferase (APT) family kinase protein
MNGDGQPHEDFTITRSSRRRDDLALRIADWLTQRVGGPATVRLIDASGANGMSSETLLVDATWGVDGSPTEHQLVLRMAPDPRDVPVFPSYDLHKQAEVMRIVGELTAAPVPRVLWHEADPSITGSEFFVMERHSGRVPPDNLPYPIDSWLLNEPTERQRQLELNMIDTIAAIHTVPIEGLDFLEYPEPGDTPLRRHVAHTRAHYEWAAAQHRRSPMLDEAFDWLERNWPKDEGETVLSWGDSRIGNVLFDEVQPVAVLDWEMVGLAPRQVDVVWMIYAHRVFQDIAHMLELPGMADFHDRDRLVERYEAATGAQLGSLDWYFVYAAILWGVVFMRVGLRQIHFGESEDPDEIEAFFHHRPSFQRFLDGDFS